MTKTEELLSSARLRAPANFEPPRASGWIRSNLVAIVIFVASAIVYSTYSIHLYETYQTNSFDLGIFAQGVKGYADGLGPISEIKGTGFSLLGDHFSPITALLAPFYFAFRSVVVLLVAQAVLFALGAVPLVSWAQRALGQAPALVVGSVYASSFGIANAVAFDFHEIAFAVPLLSFSLCALGRGRHVAAAVWAAPLVLVKEDLGLTVAAVGAVLILRRSWRLGAAVIVFGLGATLIETTVLIPLVNPSGQYGYAGQIGPAALAALLHQPPGAIGTRVTTLVLTLAITAFVCTRSSLLLVGLPTVLWRFASSNEIYWTTGFHYSAVLMPIVVAAFVDVLQRYWRQGVDAKSFARWALGASLVVNLLLALAFPLSGLLRSSFWATNPRVETLDAATRLIPQGATVATTNKLATRLLDKATVSLFLAQTVSEVHPQWIVVDVQEGWPDSSQERKQNVSAARSDGYREVFSQNDVIVLRRRGE